MDDLQLTEEVETKQPVKEKPRIRSATLDEAELITTREEKPGFLGRLRGKKPQEVTEREKYERKDVLAKLGHEQDGYRRSIEDIKPAIDEVHAAVHSIIKLYDNYINECLDPQKRGYIFSSSARDNAKRDFALHNEAGATLNRLEKQCASFDFVKTSIDDILSGREPIKEVADSLRKIPEKMAQLHKTLAALADAHRDLLPHTLSEHADGIRKADDVMRDKIIPEFGADSKTFLSLVAYADHGSFQKREMLRRNTPAEPGELTF